jgi:NAD(P)-dependent dehydrogenase (short-subunit alcohol dehydrogenase family)
MHPDKIIVTGHTGGLGKELIKSWDGKSVIRIGRQAADLTCNFNQCNLFYNQLYDYSKTLDKNTKLGIVLCAATLGEYPGTLSESMFSFEAWKEVFNVNFFSGLSIIRAFVPHMLQSQYARILWVAGGGAAFPNKEFPAYGASKAALVREVEQINLELKDKIEDFSIVALAPGAMETPMLAKVRAAGGEVKTTVSISEPVGFINAFLGLSPMLAGQMSGRFIHVRDNIAELAVTSSEKELWKLRRIEK